MLHKFLFITLLTLTTYSNAQTVLVNDVRIFNGVDAQLSKGNVLVKDGFIAKISSQAITPPQNALVINGDNRLLSPGFIDLHAHLSTQYPVSQEFFHPLVKGAYAGKAANFILIAVLQPLEEPEARTLNSLKL